MRQILTLAAIVVCVVFPATASLASTITFSNLDGTITIPSTGTSGTSSPYPSTISVSGILGSVTDVNVLINGLSHTSPNHIDMLLVGPTGANVLLMSDTDTGNAITSVNLTFDDAAAAFLPPSGSTTIASGTYKPTDYSTGGADSFGSSAPGGPYGSLLSVYNGLDPNGTWQLWVVDDSNNHTGSIASWTLEFTITDPLPDPDPDPNPAPVPEPSTMLLLGTGLIAMFRRFRG